MKLPKIFDSEGVLKFCLSYNQSPEYQKKINEMDHEHRVVFLIDEKHIKFKPREEADDLESFYRARIRSRDNA